MQEKPDTTPLSSYTTLRLGGPATRLVEATSDEQLIEVVRECDSRGVPVLLLGGGSNVVVGDGGFEGTVVLVRTRGITVADTADGTEFTVAAGEDWDAFVASVVQSGHAGVEALAGIPGSVGATPIQNVGAYGQEVAQTITAVRVWDRERGETLVIPAADCEFSYRHSRFKGTHRYVVLAVTFALRRSSTGGPVRYAELARALEVAVGEAAPPAAVREAVLRLRRGKGMVLDAGDQDTWSAGSFFTNPILSAEQAARLPADAPRYPYGDGEFKTSAAWLIEHAGFGKGFGLQRSPALVSLSTKHTLALTNRGGASAGDLLALALEIREGVFDRFGVALTPEPVLVGVGL